MPTKLKYSERKMMREALSYHAKLAFVAFCADRCMGEAKRHAAEELARAAHLQTGLDWLWRAAEGGPVDYARDLGNLHQTLDSFEPPADDEKLAVGKHDITVSKALLAVDEGFAAIRDPAIASRSVVRAHEAACSTVARAYQDSEPMEDKEAGVVDEALRRLHAAGVQPIRREMLMDIPEYERGTVSPRYLRDRRRQAVDDEDEES